MSKTSNKQIINIDSPNSNNNLGGIQIIIDDFFPKFLKAKPTYDFQKFIQVGARVLVGFFIFLSIYFVLLNNPIIRPNLNETISFYDIGLIYFALLLALCCLSYLYNKFHIDFSNKKRSILKKLFLVFIIFFTILTIFSVIVFINGGKFSTGPLMVLIYFLVVRYYSKNILVLKLIEE